MTKETLFKCSKSSLTWTQKVKTVIKINGHLNFRHLNFCYNLLVRLSSLVLSVNVFKMRVNDRISAQSQRPLLRTEVKILFKVKYIIFSPLVEQIVSSVHYLKTWSNSCLEVIWNVKCTFWNSSMGRCTIPLRFSAPCSGRRVVFSYFRPSPLGYTG